MGGHGRPLIIASEYAPTEMSTLLLNIVAERRSREVWPEKAVEVLVNCGCWHYRSRSRNWGHHELCSVRIVEEVRQCQAKSRGFSGKRSRLPAHWSSLLPVTALRGRICLLLGLGEAVHIGVLAYAFSAQWLTLFVSGRRRWLMMTGWLVDRKGLLHEKATAPSHRLT